MTSAAKANPSEQMLRAGERISSYWIEGLVGTGGMGWVYRARHHFDQRVVALKVLREDQLAHEHSVDRMMREAQVLVAVSHRGVPQFYECGVLEDGRPWIAMELVEGVALGERLYHDTTLGVDEVIDMVSSVAEVLAAAHGRGITHRDLKPDNIFLTPDDPRCGVRVIDWGIAYEVSGTRFTNLNEAIGTPTYMAPEQARGHAPAGHCDVYGLGIVAYHALAGKPPFTGGSAVEILVQHLNRPVPALAPRCPEAPIALVELIERMLDKNAAHRPSALEVHQALAQPRAQMSSHQRYCASIVVEDLPEVKAPAEPPATAVARTAPFRHPVVPVAETAPGANGAKRLRELPGDQATSVEPDSNDQILPGITG